jgi:hypothetical protein
VDLQTVFAADTHLAEGQWLKEQLNVVKLHMFEWEHEWRVFPGQRGNIITKSSYHLEVRKCAKYCVFTKDTTNIIIMPNMGERKHINTEEVNKEK